MSWFCPLCHSELIQQANNYRCAGGHQFDLAKEGYLNLLPVQHKRSKEPGDSSEMMQARRAFLDEGHYQPLRKAICGLLEAQRPESLLDIGCGEGYYTSGFAEVVANTGGRTSGLDVSKVAIRSAAKRYKGIDFCVASSHRLPVADNSLDAIVRIFAPCNPAELARVLKKTGIVITATPGPYHLQQLKGLIYQQIKLHEEAVESMPGFEQIESLQSSWMMDLTGDQATALLQMTPFAWRARAEVWQNLKQMPHFACQTDFMLRVWRKQQTD